MLFFSVILLLSQGLIGLSYVIVEDNGLYSPTRSHHMRANMMEPIPMQMKSNNPMQENLMQSMMNPWSWASFMSFPFNFNLLTWWQSQQQQLQDELQMDTILYRQTVMFNIIRCIVNEEGKENCRFLTKNAMKLFPELEILAKPEPQGKPVEVEVKPTKVESEMTEVKCTDDKCDVKSEVKPLEIINLGIDTTATQAKLSAPPFNGLMNPMINEAMEQIKEKTENIKPEVIQTQLSQAPMMVINEALQKVVEPNKNIVPELIGTQVLQGPITTVSSPVENIKSKLSAGPAAVTSTKTESSSSNGIMKFVSPQVENVQSKLTEGPVAVVSTSSSSNAPMTFVSSKVENVQTKLSDGPITVVSTSSSSNGPMKFTSSKVENVQTKLSEGPLTIVSTSSSSNGPVKFASSKVENVQSNLSEGPVAVVSTKVESSSSSGPMKYVSSSFQLNNNPTLNNEAINGASQVRNEIFKIMSRNMENQSMRAATLFSGLSPQSESAISHKNPVDHKSSHKET